MIENVICDNGPGSGSASIYIFQIIRSSDYILSLIALDWIFKFSNNKYLPFGSAYGKDRNYGAKSLDEYVQIISVKRSEQIERDTMHQTLMVEQKRSSNKRIKHNIKKRQTSYHKHNQERHIILENIRDFDPIVLITAIANDINHTIEYYPPEFALITPEEINGLEPTIIDLLIMKTSKTAVFEWQTLHKSLIDMRKKI